MDSDGNVLCSDIFTLPPTEILERQELLGFEIVRDGLGINDKRLDSLVDTLQVQSAFLDSNRRTNHVGCSHEVLIRPDPGTWRSCSLSFD